MNKLSVSKLKLDEILKKGDTVTLIDVRTLEEFNEGHFQGAVCIPVDEISKEMMETHGITTDCSIICYCLSGGRSARACTKLQSLGYANVTNVEGGLMALRKM
ncbi:MAG: rhodanese-like domain-containing protein [Candidatus Taylorbacteria bacterium]|nr:rhodanese-like domain-containing protein [Candidatus Taylorbacteria bacterium]